MTMQRPDEPDIEAAPRHWCEECRRKTLYRCDMDGIPICRECSEVEAEAGLIVLEISNE